MKYLNIKLDNEMPLEEFEMKLGKIKEQISKENGYDVNVYLYFDDFDPEDEFRFVYKVPEKQKNKKSDDMKILERLQKRMKDDPNAVHKILVSANIIDEDGNLTEHYRGDKE